MILSAAENQQLLDEIDALAEIHPTWYDLKQWWYKGLISTREFREMEAKRFEKVMQIVRGEGVTK